MAEYANPSSLVSTDWVAEHGSDANVRLVEVDVDYAFPEIVVCEPAGGQLPKALRFANPYTINSSATATNRISATRYRRHLARLFTRLGKPFRSKRATFDKSARK